jgi:multidrug resistance efflux pump
LKEKADAARLAEREAETRAAAAAETMETLQTELREANDNIGSLKAEVKRAQAFGKDAAKSAVRLQVLAPKVSVTVGGASSVDVEGAPGPKHIQQILEKQVLPRFLNAFVSEEKVAADGRPDTRAKTATGDQTETYVQDVLHDMVRSIEEKLQGVFGQNCYRT